MNLCIGWKGCGGTVGCLCSAEVLEKETHGEEPTRGIGPTFRVAASNDAMERRVCWLRPPLFHVQTSSSLVMVGNSVVRQYLPLV